MRGIKITTVSAVVLFAASVVAQTPDYFPLQVGNSWLYKSEGRLGKGAAAIEVTGTESVANQTYYQVTGFGRTALLRVTSQGNVVEYNRAAGSEQPWISFAEEEKRSFPTAIEQCVKSARIEAKSEKVTTALGSFDNALHVVFEPSCADAGLTDAWFVPEIGIVRYVSTTIAGPRVYDLVAASNAKADTSAGMVSTELALNGTVYRVPRGGSVELLARLSVRNTSDQPVTFNFNSGQRFDLAVKNSAGDVVITWSMGKVFTEEAGTEVIAAGGVKSWPITLSVPNVPPGQYASEAWVTASNMPPKAYSASVGFEVQADTGPAALSPVLTLASATVPVQGELVATLAVKNTSAQPVTLQFGSAQRYDLAVKDTNGQVVALWSSRSTFAQISGTETFPAGGDRKWEIKMPLADLAPGTYTAEAWLTNTEPPSKSYVASAAFNVEQAVAAQLETRIELSSYRLPSDGSVHLTARLSVQNRTTSPVVLRFLTGQRFDLAVEDPSGRVLIKWSDDKAFTQALGSETIPPGGELSWTIIQPVTRLAPGKYVADAWVTSSSAPSKTFSAKAGFEVAQ